MELQGKSPPTKHHRARSLDAVVAGILSVLGAAMAIGDILSIDPTTRVDSHSWLQLPVFLASMLAVLWWRRNLVVAVLVSTALMLIHLFAFGFLIRCGAGLPLAFVFSFLSAFAPKRQQVPALVLSVVLAAIVLIRDTAAGPEILPVVVLIQVGLCGIGQVVAHRGRMSDELRQRNSELQLLRDERAALEVSDDRARLSTRLEMLLDQRLSQLEAVAAAGIAADPAQLQSLLSDLENDSRQSLGDMREIVGQLRGGEVALAPAPSVAHLDALLAQHMEGGSRLQVSGDPRMLPASVELSAYRIIEHLVIALADKPSAPVHVSMIFTDDALEIVVAGPVPKGTDLRGAVARARERALLHAGSLDLKQSHGQARVLARLPVFSGV